MSQVVAMKVTLNPGVATLSEKIRLNTDQIQVAKQAADVAIRRLWAANFDSQGSAGGPVWAPLAPSTIKRKKSSQVLIATGGMRAGLIEPGGDHVAKSANSRSQTLLEFGATGRTADLVALHQKGSRNMPARDATQTTEAGKAEVSAAVRESIKEQLGQILSLKVQ